jgi:maltose O-acetyltransferase
MRRCRQLLDEYNATGYDEGEKRWSLLGEMLGSCGEDVTIQTPFKVTYGTHVYIGDHVFINYGAGFLDGGDITIGDRVMVGPDVKIYSGNHSLVPSERMRIVEGKLQLVSIAEPVTIGSNVWICGSATLCPGVTIGDGAVVAAGAVVVKNVPAGKPLI